MRKKWLKNSLIVMIFALAVMLLAILPTLFTTSAQGEEIFGKYTFHRELEINGKNVSFFESGDEYFRYYHDEEGYVLVKKDGGLFYAENNNGRPAPTNVSVTAHDYRINNLEKMGGWDVDFAEHPDLLTSYETPGAEVVEKAPLYAAASSEKQIVNLVIYIIFNDDSEATRANLGAHPANSALSGTGNSLSDYFYTMSNGELIVSSITPKETGTPSLTYVYRDNRNRSHYNINTPISERGKREAILLTNAINDVKNKFSDLSSYNLDIDADGFIDALTFIVSGAKSSDWGSLLWPHKWNLDSINTSYNNGARADIGGKKAGDYSFNFVNELDVGTLCHEFHHILGAPDLYHYERTNDYPNRDRYGYAPVAEWDLMQTQHSIPQYSLTYMRDKYIGGIGENQIVTISENGIYGLQPVSLSGAGDVLAYRTPSVTVGGKDEYFMFEYRNPNAALTYDSMLKGAGGLIIYRIREDSGLDGNVDALYKDANRPDQVFVFRPIIKDENSTSTRRENSRYNLEYAALSPDNEYFSEVGLISTSAKYHDSALYYSNGNNSGFVVEALSVNNTGIEFKVRLNAEENIDENYFDSRASISSAQMVNGGYSGVSVNINMGEIELAYIKDIRVILKSAQGASLAENTLNLQKFRQAYGGGERSFESPFVVSSKGGLTGGVFAEGAFNIEPVPSKAELWITDAAGREKLIVEGRAINNNNLSWNTIKNTKEQPFSPSIAAAAGLSVGVKYDGRVFASGTRESDFAGITNITAVATGAAHSLLLDRSKTVIFAGQSYHGEGAVTEWENIRAIAAGYYTSYGIKIDNTVVAAGLNNKGQLDVSHWENIAAISAGDGFAVALTTSGELLGAGDASGDRRDIESWTNILAISAGNNFTVGLRDNGTIVVAGNLYGKENTKLWTDIVKISAGVNVLFALRSDGTVLSVGDNSQGQCETDNLLDIVDIAAGEYHGAFLRADGVVEYTGGDDYTIANLINDNYIAATGLTLTLPQTEIYSGLTMMASYLISPINATYQRVVYTSSDASVAEVNLYGKVTAVGVGDAVITARINGTSITQTKAISVRENIPPEAIAFADIIKSIKLGESASLILIETPIGAAVMYEHIEYLSSDPSIVSISAMGGVLGEGLGEATITATYNYQGHLLQAICTVRVVLDITGIEITAQPQSNYLYGDAFDVSGGKLKVSFPSGEEEEISIASDMISNYNPFELGTQIITVTYMDKTVEFSVFVSDYVVSAKFSTLPKTKYAYGDALSVAGGVIWLTKATGDTVNKPLLLSEVSGFSSHNVGEYALAVNFSVDGRNFSLSYNITVFDTVNRIESRLVKKIYNFMEELSPTERVALIMNTGAERTIHLHELTVEGYQSNITGAHSVRFYYTDPITNITHNATDLIQVTTDGGKFDIFGAEEDGIYWYEHGVVDFPFEIVFTIGESAIVVGTDEGQGIWFGVGGFNPERLGAGIATVTVFVKSNADGEGYRVIYEPPALSTFGATRIIGEPEFIGKKDFYVYGEEPVIGLKLTLEGGATQTYYPESFAVSYDSELVDAWQDYKIKYTNKWFITQIYIKDVVLGLFAEDITVLFGSEPQINIFANMAKGGERLLEEEGITFQNLNTRVLGERTVIATYSGEFGAFSTNFKMTVEDAPKTIVEKERIKIAYKYGEQFDTQSLYTVTMLSGAVKEVAYNTLEFRVYPAFDPTKIGAQTITVEFLPTGRKFSHAVTVQNYFTHLEVDNLSRSIYTYGENIDLIVRAVYADGSKTGVSPNDYTTNYNSSRLGQQTVTISYKTGGETITGTYTVTVADKVTQLELLGAPAIKEYKYGEPANFIGLEVRITYASGKVETKKNNEIATLTITFNPLLAGAQDIVIATGGQSVSVRVTVYSAKEEALFSVTNESLQADSAKRTLTLSAPMTFNEVYQSIKIPSYLTLRMRNGAGEVYDISVVGEDVFLSGIFIDAVNAAGLAVRSYRAYLRGDANGDGQFDTSDIEGIARQYLDGYAASPVNDYDGDAAFTLTDLIKWVREANLPQDPPLNAMARAFISDGKAKKEDGDE